MRRAIDAVTFRKVPVVAIPRAGQATAPVFFASTLQAKSKVRPTQEASKSK
jgi:hypothetical protein